LGKTILSEVFPLELLDLADAAVPWVFDVLAHLAVVHPVLNVALLQSLHRLQDLRDGGPPRSREGVHVFFAVFGEGTDEGRFETVLDVGED
jgi:hypothetical protein